MGEYQLRDTRFYRIFETICILVFLLLMLIANVQIISRFLPDWLGGARSFVWTAELATYLFLFVIFVGARATQIANEHIVIEVFRDRIAAHVPHYHLLLHLATLGFGLLLVYATVPQMLTSWGRGALAIRWFHAGYLYGFVLIGFVVIVLAEVVVILKHLGFLTSDD